MLLLLISNLNLLLRNKYEEKDKKKIHTAKVASKMC